LWQVIVKYKAFEIKKAANWQPFNIHLYAKRKESLYAALFCGIDRYKGKINYRS
jgi:hypothetical protein